MRVTVKEAARILGVSEQFVRIGMQRGMLPIGGAVKMSSKWTYYISRNKLEEYAGIKNPPAATGGTHRMTMQKGRKDYITNGEKTQQNFGAGV